MRAILARPCAALALAALALAAGCAPDVEPADLVLRNGRIVTVDPTLPEAEAVAITGASIVAVGDNAEIEPYIGPATQVIDLAGRLAVPGFIESHGHFLRLGERRMNLELDAVPTWDDIVAMVGAAAREAQPGQWIVGRGWHQEKWTRVPERTVDGVPTHHELSAVSPRNPVLLTHASGHAAFANARALELAGITGATPDPAGGTIVKDENGQPTGLLRETAQRLVSDVKARVDAARPADVIDAERRHMVELAAQDALSKGVTSFQDAGSDFATIDFFKKLEAEGALPIRLYVMVRRETNEAMAERLKDYYMPIEGDDYLTVRSIKRQVNGALGSHGAWLLEPYEDMPSSTGLVLEPVEDIETTARIAIQNGFQVNTHAIGDRANREVLDIYERVFAAHPGSTGLRWRIEHAQHLHPDDVRRFADLGVVAAMQGVHATSDAPWVFARLGAARAESGAYVWRDLLDAGVVIANGTDAPVEDVDPIASFHASITRRTADGSVFFERQRMTREEALRSYTLDAAYAAFEEHLKGSITPGKLADITVISKDIMTVPEDEVATAEVDITIVGGRIRFERGG